MPDWKRPPGMGAFVDSDDFIYPTSLRQLMAVRRSRSGEVWSCTGFDLLSPQGQRVGAIPSKSCPFGSGVFLSIRLDMVLARRDVLVALAALTLRRSLRGLGSFHPLGMFRRR